MTESPINFPCDFPVKIVGRDTDAFRATANEIVERHAGESATSGVQSRPSRNGRYLALSYTVRASSRAQLDALYQDLSDSEEILWVL